MPAIASPRCTRHTEVLLSPASWLLESFWIWQLHKWCDAILANQNRLNPQLSIRLSSPLALDVHSTLETGDQASIESERIHGTT